MTYLFPYQFTEEEMDDHIRALQAEEAAMQMKIGMENDQFAMAFVSSLRHTF